MKNYLFVALALVVSLTGLAEASDDVPFMVKSFKNSSINHVEAQTSGGSIHVTGVDNSDFRVEVYVNTNNGRPFSLSKEEIQKRLEEDYDLNITLNNNKLTATAKSKERNMNWRRSLSISFRIFVPQHVSSNVGTSGGSIHMSNLTGTEDFETSGGSLHIDYLTGKITGRTSGGSIHVNHSKEDLDLTTSGGSIEANTCDGKIKLNTSGGSLRLHELKGTINASTSGGGVHGNDIAGELITHTSGGSITLEEVAASLDASTSGGSINVEMKELGSYVKLRNSGGHINLQVPKDKGLDLKLYGENIKTDMLTNFSGSVDKNKIDGKLNGGGVPITIDANGGHLYLSFK
jgi:DUF4097 and DUF4098 domain-containing protein YvlB